jgi:Fe2+ or Zn2+ uptake regulation protein
MARRRSSTPRTRTPRRPKAPTETRSALAGVLGPQGGAGGPTAYLPPQPTAHAICRRCGRIVRVPIPAAEVAELQSFVDRRPDGWSIEGMSFSFTGTCPTCQALQSVGPASSAIR